MLPLGQDAELTRRDCHCQVTFRDPVTQALCVYEGAWGSSSVLQFVVEEVGDPWPAIHTAPMPRARILLAACCQAAAAERDMSVIPP